MTRLTANPMAEITLRVNDVSLLNDIKRAVKMIRGVDSVKVRKAPGLLHTNVPRPTSRPEGCIHTTVWMT